MSYLSKQNLFIVCVTVLAYVYSVSKTKEPSPIVEVETGKLQGFESWSRNGRKYYQFRGIPFAKPPVGELRFEPPHPVEKWEGVRDATKHGADCKGFEFMIEGKLQGEESCLFLNVMTANIGENAEKRLQPVLVYIHGGAFHMRSGKSYQATYLIDEDVILVTINYRLGIFGFLNTDDDVIRGNMGFKDQVMALKWVQANIQQFGGDPDQVTIIGPSAGGASVHMMMLSPQGQGLFQRGISTGCEALSDMWQLTRNHTEHIEIVAEIYGCPAHPTRDFVNCLRRMDADKMASLHADMVSTRLYHNHHGFGPCIERPAPDAFLTEDPLLLLEEGRIASKVPWMAGVNENEGFVIVGKMMQYYSPSELLSNDKVWNALLPHMIFYNDTFRPDVAAKVKTQFFGSNTTMEEHELVETLSAMVSEKIFFKPLWESARLQSKVAPVYLFFYRYKSAFSLFNFLRWAAPQSTYMSSRIPIAYYSIREFLDRLVLSWWKPYHQYGAAHGDENFILFNIADVPEFITEFFDSDMSRALVKTVADFAHFSKPVHFKNLTWPSVEPSKPMPVMQMSAGHPEVAYDLLSSRLKFWEDLNLPRE